MAYTPKKYNKPKINLQEAEYVLWFYLLPAYVQIDSAGKQKNILFRGIDTLKNREYAMERLLRLPQVHRHKYYVCLLKRGLKGPVERVWLKGGREIPVEQWENRKNRHERSFLRMWVLPHEHLLLQMKKLGLVNPGNKGLTWYSTDVDVNQETGAYIKGYDVAMFSLIHQLKQIKGQFATAYIYDNSQHKGNPLAEITHQGELRIQSDWLGDELVTSNYYKPFQLGLFDYYE